MAKVLIWMPVYNEARYVRAAIASVLAQTHHDFTLIVSDNHSTDGSADITRATSDSRVTVVHPPEHVAGIPHANFLWQLAGTHDQDYTITLGGHDLWNPDMLQRLVERMERPMSHGEQARAIIYPETYQVNADNQVFGMYGEFAQWVSMPRATMPLHALTGVSSPQFFGLWNEKIRRQLPMRHECSGWDHLIVVEASLHGSIGYEPAAKFLMRSPPPADNFRLYGERHLSPAILAARDQDFRNQLEWLEHITTAATSHVPTASRELFRALLLNAIVGSFLVLRGQNLHATPGGMEAFEAAPAVRKFKTTSIALAGIVDELIAGSRPASRKPGKGAGAEDS